MKRVVFATVAFIALLVLLISGCGAPTPEPTTTPLPATPTPMAPTYTPLPPTPTATSTRIPPTATPEVPEPNYTNSAMGFSMWYPDDWAYEEEIEGVVFASWWELIFGAEMKSGALMSVTSEELEGLQTVEDLVETLLDEPYFAEMESSDPEPHTVGGQRGIIVTLEGTPEDTAVRLRGFVAGAEHHGRGHLFIGVSAADEWPEYGLILETMLSSVRFEAIERVYANPELGLRMWYPEAWILQEDGQQVIFASSEEVIREGDLETAAAMLVTGSSLAGMSLEEWFEDMASEFPFEQGGPTSDMKPRTIGDHSGVFVTMEGIPSGAEFSARGFMAAGECEGWGYFFLGVSGTDGWSEYASILGDMLDSVEFIE